MERQATFKKYIRDLILDEVDYMMIDTQPIKTLDISHSISKIRAT
jgi:hypothetical protein